MSSGPIQIIPTGLLGLLQLKNMGKNPSQLADVVQSIINLGEWYAESDVRMSVGATAALATGTFGQQLTTTVPLQQVPEGEAWILRSMTIGADCPAGDAIRGFCLMRPPGINQPRLLGPQGESGVHADASQFRAAWNPSSFVIAPPGTRFGVYLTRFLVAAPQLVNCYVAYTPMRV